MSKKNILIVEDDHHLSQLVTYNLEKSGFHCFAAQNAESGLDLIENYRIDLVILDIMLPGMDGFECCKKIKQNPKHHNIPIIMLTAKNEEIDRIVGFELGADDYIGKPFSTRELILRVKAVIKRDQASETGGELLSIEHLRIDIPRHRVTVREKVVELTHMEFKLLLTLVQRKGRVQSRDTLLEDVWHIESDVSTRTIDTHIRHLRQKLGDMGKSIETVRGLGYRFSEEE